jgi:hypothetical protein
MFVIHFPVTFKAGDTIHCEINGEPAHVTYEDEDTLVIEPSEVDLRENEKVVEICCNSGNFTEAELVRIPKWLHDGSRDFREILHIEPVDDLNRFVCADAEENELEREMARIEKEEVKS